MDKSDNKTSATNDYIVFITIGDDLHLVEWSEEFSVRLVAKFGERLSNNSGNVQILDVQVSCE